MIVAMISTVVDLVNPFGTLEGKIDVTRCRFQQRSPRDWGMTQNGVRVTMFTMERAVQRGSSMLLPVLLGAHVACRRLI